MISQLLLFTVVLVQDSAAPPAISAPADGTVLFAGDEASDWLHVNEGGESIDAAWPIVDGALVVPPAGLDLVSREGFRDVHLHLDFLVPYEPSAEDDARGASGVIVAGQFEIALLDSFQKDTNERTCGAIGGLRSPIVNASKAPGTWQTLDVTLQHDDGAAPRASVWLNDVLVQDDVPLIDPGSAESDQALAMTVEGEGSRALDFGARQTWAVHARFKTTEGGTLVSKCPSEGEWVPDAKALFLRGGHLVYDIGWVGALETRRRFNDGRWHDVVLTSARGDCQIWVDGKLEAEREGFRANDDDEFVLKVGDANEDFGGTYEGSIARAGFYAKGLDEEQARALSSGDAIDATPDYVFGETNDDDPLAGFTDRIRLQAEGSPVRFANIWVRPLADVDHAALIRSWDETSYARGEEVYNGLCVLCHGADGKKPTNPKARPFALGVLENGSDPLRLFETITSGYKEMPSNAWLRPDQRYDVVHYMREKFLRDENPSQYFDVTDEWLNALPKGKRARAAGDEELDERDYGPALATQLGPEVGAGLAVRLDEDLTYGLDLQTMQSVGVWEGPFLELRNTQHYQQRGEGITRPGADSLPGLDAWGWGFGGTLDWERAQRPERGPLPKAWLDHHGRYVHDGKSVLRSSYTSRPSIE